MNKYRSVIKISGTIARCNCFYTNIDLPVWNDFRLCPKFNGLPECAQYEVNLYYVLTVGLSPSTKNWF